MIDPGFFVPASTAESLAAMIFNAFVMVFLLPIVLMDICYFLPMAIFHVMKGQARLRMIPTVLGGAALWLAVLAVALLLLRLVNGFAIDLLYRTWSGLFGTAIGTVHTLLSLFRYRKSMREYYYAQMLEKNLSPHQSGKNAALRLALQSGELDAQAMQQDRTKDYLSQRIVRAVLNSRQGIGDIMDDQAQNAKAYFL